MPPPSPVQENDAEMPVWLQRIFVVIYVLFCIELGLVLIVLPWTDYWFTGTGLLHWPTLHRLLQEGFVRGAVSGLGFLDICLGILEAARYRDRR